MINTNLPALEPTSIEELVELGSYCEGLMMHPIFNRLTAMFAHSAFTHWVSTKAEDNSAREGIYASVDGLQQFLAQMSLLVNAKNKYMNPEGEALPDDGDEEFTTDGE